MQDLNLLNQKRYDVTAWFYDILDYPWELQYRKWRSGLLEDVSGEVLEAGVGTGRNLKYYPPPREPDCDGFQCRDAQKSGKTVRESLVHCSVRA